MKGLVKFAPRLLVLGLVLLVVGFGMAGFDYKNLNTEGPYEQKTYETTADITALTIDDVNSAITLCPSPDGVLRVTYYEREDEHYEVDLDAAGALSLRYRSDKPWYDFIGINLWTEDTRMVVYLPERFVVPVSLASTNGKLRVENLQATSLKLRSTNGSVDIDGVQAQAIDLYATNGDVELLGVQVRESIEAGSVNGAIELGRVQADRIAAHSINGPIGLDAVDAQNAEYRSTNGNIYGHVVGQAADYSIESRTVVGNNNLTSGGTGARKLVARNTNAGIDIQFTP